MLTTEDKLRLEEYAFKSSPESCSDHSYYSSDCMDITSDEDFLTQLSCDLDIPLFLNAGEDELNLLNSFLDQSPDEILSNITSPPHFKENDIADEINELQSVDFSHLGPESFPNLQSDIKTELFDTSSSNVSIKSNSPELRPNATPITFKNSFTNEICNKTVQNKILTKLPTKRVPIQPKTPYSVPVAPNNNKYVVIKNEVPDIKPVLSPNGAPKVVILDNVTSLPIRNITTNVAVSVTSTNVPSMIINSGNGLSMNLDPRILKRQQRKIKNRESACLSRKKKKDYLTSLEDKVKDLTVENERLQNENIELKKRLAQFEDSPNYFNAGKKNTKQTVVLCAFLLVVGFNLDFIRSPFSLRNEMDLVPKNIPKLPDHHSRGLLWAPDDSNSENIINNNNNTAGLLPYMCPAAINQTESARLVLELEKWIGRPVEFPAKTDVAANNTKQMKFKPRLPRRKKFKIDLSSVAVKNKHKPDETKHEIQVFSPKLEQIYSEFFQAINRQDDTFYVVSFSEHHMLLPALHHNKTRRPKMSLIMPSMLPNDTSSHSFMPLMQIDCEVLDTRLINVKYGAIPRQYRQYDNVTKETPEKERNVADSVNSSTGKYYEKPYKPYFLNKKLVKDGDGFFKIP